MATILAPTQKLPRLRPGRESAPFPARAIPWQLLRGGENCCHGDRLGTQASVQLANTTIAVLVSVGFVWVFFQKSLKTAVLEDVKSSGALVLTKLIE